MDKFIKIYKKNKLKNTYEYYLNENKNEE